jgi:hypothetical protein
MLMNKILSLVCLFVFLSFFFSGHTQNSYVDSLKKILATQKEDTNEVKILTSLSYWYLQYSADTAAGYAQIASTLAEKLNFKTDFFTTEVGLASF